MGVKLDGLRLSIGLNLPWAVPVATGCTISWNRIYSRKFMANFIKILNFWVKNFDKHFFGHEQFLKQAFHKFYRVYRIGPNWTTRIKRSAGHWFMKSQWTISTRKWTKWTNGHELTEFVSAILEFQNPSVEFETEKKFRFWFDNGGTKLRFIFCAFMLVRATSAL